MSVNKLPLEALLSSTRSGDLVATESAVYFSEGLPKEGGRSTINRVVESGCEPILPQEYSAKSRVNEYGGGSITVHGETVYFVNGKDQNIHKLENGSVTSIMDDPNVRYADMVVHPSGEWLYAVQEEHANEVITTLTMVHFTNESQVVHSGYDFYAKPKISPDGSQIAFLAWNLPFMPWDETYLYRGKIDEQGRITDVQLAAGGDGVSINQVAFAPDNALYYTSDKNGFWHVYCEGKQLFDMPIDVGYPAWVFGIERLAFLKGEAGFTLAFVGTTLAEDTLYLYHPNGSRVEKLDTPFSSIQTISATNSGLYVIGTGPQTPKGLYKLGSVNPIHLFDKVDIDLSSIPEPEHIAFVSGDSESYGVFFPPCGNVEAPPVLINVHGGPTSHASTDLSLQNLFWQTRGFAVCELNHRGSSGYGRDYRRLLNAQWGLVDVEDAKSLVDFLTKEKKVDPKKIVIMGGSAGGFTALNALAHHTCFAGGISRYGIANLQMLAKDTHKFESKMMEMIVAPYPEGKEEYIKRSPLSHIDSMETPLLLLQGLDDPVVPPNQSQVIYDALKKKGVDVELMTFEGESHGFRKAETIHAMYDGILKFLHLID